MALKVFILENSSTKKKRQADIQKAVKDFLKKPKIKVVYDENNGIASVENSEKPVYISITCTNAVMLVVLCDKPVGVDGEYLPRVLSPENKVDYTSLAERFFSDEEAEYMHDCGRENEAESFLKIWVRKEAYVKAVGKTVAEFPKFSVIEGSHFLSKVGGVPSKKFSIKFPECENYVFAIAGME